MIANLPAGYHLQVAEINSLPVSRDLFKKHIRVELVEDYEDELLDLYLWHAYEYVSEVSDASFVVAAYTLTLPCLVPGIVLPRPPVTAITQIDYIDTDGVTQTLASNQYRLTAAGQLLPAFDVTWPGTRTNTPDAATIQYTAGTAIGEGINATRAGRATQAVLLLAAHWFKNREDTTEKQLANIPTGVPT